MCKEERTNRCGCTDTGFGRMLLSRSSESLRGGEHKLPCLASECVG